MPARAALFDIDGTLVDSNYLHVDAWQRALAEAGHPVDAWRVHREIGKDAQALLGDLDVPDALRDAASDGHEERYLATTERLRPFAGARELLAELHARGAAIVLATSAPAQELAALLEVLALGFDPLTTDADDVETAKPDPSLVAVALERAGVEAAEALFVGDSAWDMIAARRLGVRAIGVRSGGIGADELTDAGAERVVDDVAALRAEELLR